MSASKCKYFNSCPSATGWCASFNAFNTGCIPFILAAYKNNTDKLRAEAMKKAGTVGGDSVIRPCYVVETVYANNEPFLQEKRKAMFHRWEVGGRAVVEFEDGSAECVPASCIQFVQSFVKEYLFAGGIYETGNDADSRA